jgi:hypothetical protein
MRSGRDQATLSRRFRITLHLVLKVMNHTSRTQQGEFMQGGPSPPHLFGPRVARPSMANAARGSYGFLQLTMHRRQAATLSRLGDGWTRLTGPAG